MASDAAELVRATFDVINRRDLPAAMALVKDDAELYPIRSQLEGTVYRGPSGVAEAIAAAWADWDELHFELEEVRALPGGVFALTRFQARGAASGVDLDVPTGWHFRLSGGRIAYARAYSKPDDAIRAAGGDPTTT